MSRGYCGYADLHQSDDTMVMYKYCCYKLDNDSYSRYRNLEDGEIYIEQNAFVERVKRDITLGDIFETGKIQIKNASGTWSTTIEGIDIMALRILRKIFNEYQDTGKLPEHIVWFC